MPAGVSGVVERADVAAGRERPAARGRHHHPRDRRIVAHSCNCRISAPHHAKRHGIERLRAIERDEAGRAAALEQDVRQWGVIGRQLGSNFAPMLSHRTASVAASAERAAAGVERWPHGLDQARASAALAWHPARVASRRLLIGMITSSV